MYYFDPAFGYIYTLDTGSVRYGLGPVVPHNSQTVTQQRYKRFEGWVPIEPHHVPDEWLIAFKNPHDSYEEKITEIHWGWREWTVLAPIWTFIGYVLYKFVTNFY
jgi:hypothetical protein